MWQQAGHPPPVLSFAGSSTLAKQIEAGAPADLYASADLAWMDYLQERRRIDPSSRVNLLGNELVLIVPRGQTFRVEMRPGFDFGHAFSGRLCTGEPGTVPAGTYARQSLEALGWWPALQGRIVGTEDVRSALAFVARGECAAGIVYATDATVGAAVQVLARFPADTHQPIVYPFALVSDSRSDSRAFLDFLKSSPEAVQVFVHHGFSVLTH